MKRWGHDEERLPPTSASRLLARRRRAFRRLSPLRPRAHPRPNEHPLGVSVEVPMGALAPTVAEWMPVGGDAIGASRLPRPRLWRGARSACPASDPLASVGLHEGALVDRTYRVERALGVGGMGVGGARDRRAARSQGRDQVHQAGALRVPGDAHVLPQRSARDGARRATANVLSVFAFGEHEGTPVLRDGVRRRPDGRSLAARARAGHVPRPRRGGAHPRAGVPRRRGHPRDEHRASRPQAVEPPHRRRRRVRGRRPRRRARPRHRDERQLHRRQRALHGARGRARRRRGAGARRPTRHLRARLHRVRALHRPSAVHRRRPT